MLGVVGARDVLAHLDRARVGLLEAEGELHEGRFAGAVGAHEGHVVATVECGVCVGVDEIVAKGLADVLERDHHVARARGLGEAEAHLARALGKHHELALDLLDALHALLGLGGLGGLVAELVYEDLHVGDLALLGGALGAELLEVVLALAQVGGVVARVGGEAAVLKGRDVAHAGVHEGAVVAHEQHGSVVAREELLEPLNALEVEVVRGLVEQQQVGVAQEELGEGYAHLPAAREVLCGFVEVVDGESEAAQDGAGAALELVAAQALEAVLGVAVLLEKCVEAAALAGVGDGSLELGDALSQMADLGGGGHDLLEGGGMAGELGLLLEVTNRGALLEAYRSLVGGLDAHDDLEQRGLASAVGTHEGPALAGVELKRGALVKGAAAE